MDREKETERGDRVCSRSGIRDCEEATGRWVLPSLSGDGSDEGRHLIPALLLVLPPLMASSSIIVLIIAIMDSILIPITPSRFLHRLHAYRHTLRSLTDANLLAGIQFKLLSNLSTQNSQSNDQIPELFRIYSFTNHSVYIPSSRRACGLLNLVRNLSFSCAGKVQSFAWWEQPAALPSNRKNRLERMKDLRYQFFGFPSARRTSFVNKKKVES